MEIIDFSVILNEVKYLEILHYLPAQAGAQNDNE